MRKTYEVVFDEYREFIEENFPSSVLNKSGEDKIKKLFFVLNNGYVTSQILLDFEFVTEHNNYFYLLKEYKTFITRLLITINLNDKYLIDNIIRLLVEKLYRIVTGIHNPSKTANKLRKMPRRDMGTLIENIVSSRNKQKLDDLYSDFSKEIHMTNLDEVNLYDLKKIYSMDTSLSDYLINKMEEIMELFFQEVLFCLCEKKSELINTNFKIRINNNVENETAELIIRKVESFQKTYSQL